MKIILLQIFLSFCAINILAQKLNEPVNNNLIYSAPQKYDDGIEVSTLSEHGLDEKIILSAVDSIKNGVYPNIHSLLILRNNKLVFEEYFPGEDAIVGKGKVGFRQHNVDSLHDIRSVTKSIVGAAILIALKNGQIKSLDDPIFNYFPEYAEYNTGYKSEITIKHLLTMTDGLDWDENTPYTDTTNSEIYMNYYSKDPIEFYLSRRSLHKPGTVFNYSGGCTQMLAAIIRRITGKEIDVFVSKNIFEPLGISKFEWVKRKDGIPFAASGLRITSRDMLKFGLLYLNNGNFNGRQIIQESLAIEAQSLQFEIEPGFGYGYQIWISTDEINGEPVTTVEASGNGGQIIAVCKNYDMIIVITAGNYNRRDLGWASTDIYLKYIYPAVVK